MLNGEKKLVFGSEAKEADQKLKGERIMDRHFEISYERNVLWFKSLCTESSQSCGIYRKLEEAEDYILKPGCAFRIGTLEFEVERFNTGIVSDIGQR